MLNRYYPGYRLNALITKEFLLLIRERITFALLLIVPMLQVIMFSLVINADPKHIPTALLNSDPSPFTRTIVKGLENTNYFDFKYDVHSEAEANQLLDSGQVLFIVDIPANFSQELVRGNKPQISLQANAINPIAVNNAINTTKTLSQTILQDDLRGVLSPHNQQTQSSPFEFTVNPKFNPENNSLYFSVPGLIGTVLSISLMMMTLLSITREKDGGTMESLLATPTKSMEVILSKLIPFIMLGYIQFTCLLLLAYFVFRIPFEGDVGLLFFAALPFIVASLLLGLFVSGLASSQFQAMQLGGLFLLPNFLFSGFIFPFVGMPIWAQWIGECLPLTHFLRILIGILLKGNGFAIIMHEIWPMLGFIAVILSVILMMFHQTLD